MSSEPDPSDESAAESPAAAGPLSRRPVTAWVALVVGSLGLAVVAWSLLTSGSGIVHGHPAYWVVLAVTTAVSGLVVWRSVRSTPATGPTPTGRVVLRVVGILVLLAWVLVTGWLRPFSAVEPALTAMESDGAVTVAEYPTQIVLIPRGKESPTGVFFQPGARVDARAYAAVLRPIAEAGHVVVIAKQPLGIGFLATGAFESTRSAYPKITGWVVGGHSLGGTVAAIDADAHDSDATSPVVGLLLYASYPASNMRDSLTCPVLSISGSNDGLATPAKINAAKVDLPASTRYMVVQGAVHAFFGDYGPQPGDGTPTISQDDARGRISQASVDFVSSVHSAAQPAS